MHYLDWALVQSLLLHPKAGPLFRPGFVLDVFRAKFATFRETYGATPWGELATHLAVLAAVASSEGFAVEISGGVNVEIAEEQQEEYRRAEAREHELVAEKKRLLEAEVTESVEERLNKIEEELEEISGLFDWREFILEVGTAVTGEPKKGREWGQFGWLGEFVEKPEDSEMWLSLQKRAWRPPGEEPARFRELYQDVADEMKEFSMRVLRLPVGSSAHDCEIERELRAAAEMAVDRPAVKFGISEFAEKLAAKEPATDEPEPASKKTLAEESTAIPEVEALVAMKRLWHLALLRDPKLTTEMLRSMPPQSAEILAELLPYYRPKFAKVLWDARPDATPNAMRTWTDLRSFVVGMREARRAHGAAPGAAAAAAAEE